MANYITAPVVRPDLGVNGPQFRRVAHGERVRSQYHQCAGTLRKIRDDYPKLAASHRRLHQRHQLLRSVDVPSPRVQEKVDALLWLKVVKQFHKPRSVVTINR